MAVKANKVQWLDNAGGLFNCFIGFCPNKLAWDKEMKRLGVDSEPYPKTAGRCTRLYKEDEDNPVVIVTIGDKMDDVIDPAQTIAVIVHECVHVVQFICEHWGEKSPSIEFQAYATQYVFQHIYHAYLNTRPDRKDDGRT